MDIATLVTPDGETRTEAGEWGDKDVVTGTQTEVRYDPADPTALAELENCCGQHPVDELSALVSGAILFGQLDGFVDDDGVRHVTMAQLEQTQPKNPAVERAQSADRPASVQESSNFSVELFDVLVHAEGQFGGHRVGRERRVCDHSVNWDRLDPCLIEQLDRPLARFASRAGKVGSKRIVA